MTQVWEQHLNISEKKPFNLSNTKVTYELYFFIQSFSIEESLNRMLIIISKEKFAFPCSIKYIGKVNNIKITISIFENVQTKNYNVRMINLQ